MTAVAILHTATRMLLVSAVVGAISGGERLRQDGGPFLPVALVCMRVARVVAFMGVCALACVWEARTLATKIYPRFAANIPYSIRSQGRR